MKKFSILFLCFIFISGCATYKFQRGQKTDNQGYVVSRNGFTIIEYTIGKNNSVPSDLNLAKQRFQQRRDTVEEYYTKMGLVESRAKQYLWDPPISFFKFLKGMVTLPFVASEQRRYEKDPKYRQKVDREEEEKEEKERLRIANLRTDLNTYIQRELTKEPEAQIEPEVVAVEKETPYLQIAAEKANIETQQSFSEIKDLTEEVAKKKESMSLEKVQEIEVGGKVELPAASTLPAEVLSKEAAPEKIPSEGQAVTEEIVKETIPQERIEAMGRTEVALEKSAERPEQKTKAKQKRIVTATTSQPKAVIVAKPQKGYSPLIVHFNGTKSTSPGARIVSYAWDFGDGDTSNKPKPVNIYYSGSYEPRHFTATLTVRDNKGNSASTSLDIEVLNK
jgi:hypothetical protein